MAFPLLFNFCEHNYTLSFASQFGLTGPIFGQLAVDVYAVGDKVAVVVRADSEVVVITGEGAVQFRVETADDSLVTNAAAEAAVLVVSTFELNTDFAPGGIVRSALHVLGEDAAAGFAISVLASVSVTYFAVRGELPGLSGRWKELRYLALASTSQTLAL
jgi:flavoprotein